MINKNVKSLLPSEIALSWLRWNVMTDNVNGHDLTYNYKTAQDLQWFSTLQFIYRVNKTLIMSDYII